MAPGVLGALPRSTTTQTQLSSALSRDAHNDYDDSNYS